MFFQVKLIKVSSNYLNYSNNIWGLNDGMVEFIVNLPNILHHLPSPIITLYLHFLTKESNLNFFNNFFDIEFDVAPVSIIPDKFCTFILIVVSKFCCLV